MSKKKENLSKLYENQPSNKSKENAFKPSKLEKKNLDDKNVFEKEKTQFLKKKKRRYQTKKADSSLPSSMKNLVAKYGDVMANVGDNDVKKYNEYKKYKKKSSKGKTK